MTGDNRLRIRTEVEGVVQGVGFRPFIYQLARRFGLGGFVQNTSHGALIEIEGRPEATDAFFLALREKLPPLALVTKLSTRRLPPLGQTEFSIRHSGVQPSRQALISPDVAVCDDCLAEMFDPLDRRYRYPFINCTNCGPRYTIILDVPYDRATTTMRAFTMCRACANEYHNPADRRFHAQPNACPVCGPQVTLVTAAGERIEAAEPLRAAADLLRQGMIVAVKGLGGFHLAADATNDRAVRRLRSRKQREEKPLAVMSPDLEAIRAYAFIRPDEETVLFSAQRPIVLLTAKMPSPLAPSVAPDNKYIGAMLPYAPLHHLLLKGFTALVMTSGNLSEEPIAIDNQEALTRLGRIADYFLLHDRDIHLRSDDSVVRLSGDKLRQVRRSRGFAPLPIFLKEPQAEVLAVGGELKNTVCLTKNNRAFLSQHIGDLENVQTLEFFEMTIEHLERILDIRPKAVAYDLHPEYLSTKWALEQTGLELIGVQHHHAHVASALAEHGLDGPVIGLACDGAGYGPDGGIWGGEILVAGLDGFERRGHLEYLPLPGGAAAIKEPWRMAVSYLVKAFGPEMPRLELDLLERHDPDQLDLLIQVLNKKVASPLTSSLGRLFDAAAALIGLKDSAAFEGQAAMGLEMCCPEGDFPPYDFDLAEEDGRHIIKPQALIRDIVHDLGLKRSREEISGRFHAAVVRAFSELALKVADETGIRTAVLSGGCFQNQILVRGLTRALVIRGLNVYTQNTVPVNDGGLALGQAAAAGFRLAGQGLK
ncbi:MAG: carbamoyltransferase HypF [Thermodesulfobacteriota bacterium]